MQEVQKKLTELLEEKFSSEEYHDCYLVDINIFKSGKIQVFVDCDSGVNLYKCTKLSRLLEAYLDESLVLGERYTLEVSSPGVERPLMRRQYPKNIGRKVKVKMKDGEIIKGKLCTVSESGIKVEIAISKKELKELDIAFESILETKIIVSF